MTEYQEKLWTIEVYHRDPDNGDMKHGFSIADECEGFYAKIENFVKEIENIKEIQMEISNRKYNNWN